MPGRGPAPKDPSRRVRNSGKGGELRVLEVSASEAPDLPPLRVPDSDTGVLRSFDWPDQTLMWWRAWIDSPLSDDWTAVDWAFMLETAYLHAQFWMGEAKYAQELRLRMAKVGATAEDRARLRVQFNQADKSDEGRAATSDRQPRRHAGLRLA